MAEEGATVKPFPDFDAAEDAKVLRKAMKGFGTDEDSIIDILTSRSNDQRQEIIEAFNSEFKRDLLKDLTGEISGNFRKLILAMMDPPMVYLAKECKNAMKGITGTDYDTITEILCTRTNEEIQQIAQIYEETYDQPLMEAVEAEISDDYKRMLVPMLTVCLNGERDESDIRLDKATEQAKQLNAAFKTDWETSDEDAFITQITGQPLGQLRLIRRQYDIFHGYTAGNSLEEVTEKKFSEIPKLKTALLALVKFTKGEELYYADKIEQSLAGLGTDDSALIRTIVSRSEIDLEKIKQKYEKTYDKNLAEAVASETSGDYRKTILKIIESV